MITVQWIRSGVHLWWGRTLLGILGLSPFAPQVAAAEPPPATPRVIVQELPPFVYNRRGKPEGFIPELIEALGTEMGFARPLSIEFAPLPRAADLLRRHPNAIYAPVARVPANQSQYKWVRPLLHARVYAFRRASAEPLPTDIEALKSAKRIAIGSGGGQQAMAEAAGFRNLLMVRGQVDAFRRMMTGEAEYCIASELAMLGILETEKVPPEAVQATGFVLFDTEVHLAFSPLVAERDLARWHAALEQLRRSGRLETLARQHFGSATYVPK